MPIFVQPLQRTYHIPPTLHIQRLFHSCTHDRDILIIGWLLQAMASAELDVRLQAIWVASTKRSTYNAHALKPAPSKLVSLVPSTQGVHPKTLFMTHTPHAGMLLVSPTERAKKPLTNRSRVTRLSQTSPPSLSTACTKYTLGQEKIQHCASSRLYKNTTGH